MAYQLKNQGLDIEQLADKINDLKTKMKVFLTVEDLIYLYRGGRVSKTKATMANIINIKPLIKVNEKGELEVYGKSRGRKKSIVDLVNTISEHFYDNNIEVYISFLRKKLGYIDSATSITTIRGVGYKLEEN